MLAAQWSVTSWILLLAREVGEKLMVIRMWMVMLAVVLSAWGAGELAVILITKDYFQRDQL
jgi:hypothetical protein